MCGDRSAERVGARNILLEIIVKWRIEPCVVALLCVYIGVWLYVNTIKLKCAEEQLCESEFLTGPVYLVAELETIQGERTTFLIQDNAAGRNNPYYLWPAKLELTSILVKPPVCLWLDGAVVKMPLARWYPTRCWTISKMGSPTGRFIMTIYLLTLRWLCNSFWRPITRLYLPLSSDLTPCNSVLFSKMIIEWQRKILDNVNEVQDESLGIMDEKN